MSTKARKARKRAGIPFTPKPAKVPTPVEERASTRRAGWALLRKALRATHGHQAAAAALLEDVAKGEQS